MSDIHFYCMQCHLSKPIAQIGKIVGYRGSRKICISCCAFKPFKRGRARAKLSVAQIKFLSKIK